MANLIGPVVGGLLTVAIDWRACWWFLVPASARGRAGAVALRAARGARGREPRDRRACASAWSAAAALVAALTFAVMIGAFYLGQQYLQIAAGYSALGAAAALTLIALLVGVGGAARGPPVGLARRGADGRARASAWRRSALGVLGDPRRAARRASARCRCWCPFGLGLGLLFVPASRAALNAVPQAKHGRVSSLLSTCAPARARRSARCWPASALSGGVTDDHVRIALLGAGAGLCLVVGLAGRGRALAEARRHARLDIGSRRPSSRGGAASPASRSRR